jgi:arginine utilization regulatory protein
MSKLYGQIDALMIVNKQGIIEYSAMTCDKTNSFQNEGITGKHILEVYPSLTEKTSSVLRVLKTGNPIYDEKQTVTDSKGFLWSFVNSTFPIEYNNEIIGAVEASISASKWKQKNHTVLQNSKKQKSNNSLYTLDNIITKNPLLLHTKEKIKKIAQNNSSVLICGDTGTGKEMVAQAIHSHSLRRNEPFISQNCSAIPSTLLESIFFGTVKGSYTGSENKKGLFELANRGTLFLDEINSMDIGIQAKILKAIEEKKIRRVGGESYINIDIRIVSAMNSNPLKTIEDGLLRKDLYYRLSVIQINLPPLINRTEDITLLTDYFIKKYNNEMNKNITAISEMVEKTFYNYNWPGNIREFKNAIESAFNLATGNTITLKDIPEYIIYPQKSEEPLFREVSKNKSLPKLVQSYEKEIILEALSTSKNITAAARKLQITRQSLQYKMEKYNL